MSTRRTLTMILALTGGLALAGCETFDIENLFNQKKPLPGDRRVMFPEGVPGVTQGVPSGLVRGNQPVAEAPPAPAPEPEKPKPKPPRRSAAPARPAASVTVQPAQQQSASQQQPAAQQRAPAQLPGQAAWPEQPGAGSAPPPTVWPDPPRPGTTAR